MTSEDRQIFLTICETLHEAMRCQEDANLSWRALYLSLEKKHFQNLASEVLESRKDADFATELSVRLGEATHKLEVVIESLKRQSSP